ncbi:MAG: YggS family pyridoxal phosphate-dependent enzyme [Desulfarculus sp.]|nr:YggS family pyridoxal phosphate-dependent enzyme [Desulfarculus sp.]
MSIAQNLQAVRERMAQAAIAAGRDPASVRLVAVSKMHAASEVAQALAAGQLIFGENYAQEAQAKIAAVGPGAHWHFIGHLQGNKARLAAGLFDMIESVHSLKLAQALDRHCQEMGKRLPVLLQVNLGGEAQKSGCPPHEAPALASAMAALPGLELKGLMTMPPFYDDPGQARPIFAGLRRLAASLAPGLPPGSMDELSMGMSGDFEAAIAEGSTLVRVGTAIFGQRG